jgi:hypothetical protein
VGLGDALGRVDRKTILVQGNVGSSFAQPNLALTNLSPNTVVSSITTSTSNANSFNDVSESHWAHEFIKALSAARVIKGYGDGTFKPENNMSIAEFLSITINAADLPGSFWVPDSDPNPWYSKYMAYALNKKLITTTEALPTNMDGAITRELAFYILWNIFTDSDSQALTPLDKLIVADSETFAETFTDAEDITENDTSRDYLSTIIKLYMNDIISGTIVDEETKILPQDFIKRSEVSTLIAKCMGLHFEANDTIAIDETKSGTIESKGIITYATTVTSSRVYPISHIGTGTTLRVYRQVEGGVYKRIPLLPDRTNDYLIPVDTDVDPDGIRDIIAVTGEEESDVSVTLGSNYEFEAFVNHWFDGGYSLYYNETAGTSSTTINGYQKSVSEMYLELFGLEIKKTNAREFTSIIDTCKHPNNNRANIDTLCTHYPDDHYDSDDPDYDPDEWHPDDHTNSLHLAWNFLQANPGSNTETNILWSGHKTTWDSGDNRSFSWGTVIANIDRFRAIERTRSSEALLKHELNHQYDVRDHYHEEEAPGDEETCMNRDICSRCKQPGFRPDTCIMFMYVKDVESIDRFDIICGDWESDMGCKGELASHLSDHHRKVGK